MNQRVVWGLVVSVFLLNGCGDDNLADLKQYVSDIKSRPPASIKQLPDIKQVETFIYQATNKRDPFALLEQPLGNATAVSNNGITPDFSRRKEELEQYSLDSLHMVGTIEQAGVMWALVLNHEGELFRVRAGNYMGQNHGQVTRVTSGRIELTEIVPDGSGGWQERQAAVALIEKPN